MNRFSAAGLLFATAVLPAMALAQERTVVTHPDPQIPIEIAAKDISVNDNEGVATFVGNVVVVRGASRLECSRAVVRYGASARGDRKIVMSLECER